MYDGLHSSTIDSLEWHAVTDAWPTRGQRLYRMFPLIALVYRRVSKLQLIRWTLDLYELTQPFSVIALI